MTSEFAGLKAIVTGAGSGIGLAVAKALSDAGATVMGLDIHEGSMKPFATWISCNIGDDASVAAAFVKIAAISDVIDIVVNNAGIGAVGTIADATSKEWNEVLNINVIGISRISSAALPFLRKSASAAIVNTCSIAAVVGIPKRAIYSASKGAVMSLTLAMAADFVTENIRVNAVTPGTSDTPWVGRLLANSGNPEAERIALEARQPLGRLVSPQEVARAILYLASPLQASTTGTLLPVDGGIFGLRVPPRK